jgi:hypothetical protein
MLGLYSFVLEPPEDGSPVPKHVGVLILVVNSIVLSELVGKYIDCKNMHSRNNIKFA